MRQPRSIRFHLAIVFFFFFLLVIVLGLFSVSRLSSFNRVSENIAELWLPNTRVLGDLNNFTSDFRAVEGSNLLARDPSDIAVTEKEMEQLDRSIAQAERNYEQIRHDAGESSLYASFKERWNDYRKVVNQMLTLSRANRKDEAIAMYLTGTRSAYNAASDALGQLTARTVARAHEASGRVAAVYRQAIWLVGLAMALAAVMVAAALFYISRSISAPLLHLADCMHRLAGNDTDIDIRGTKRRDEIGEMARAAVVFRNNAIELMRSQQRLIRQTSMLEEKLAQEQRLALLQRNFVSMASHEFRTPLSIIDGHAQRLIKLKDRLAPAEIDERAGKVRGAVLRLTHLIDNLLDSSRLIDAGAPLYFHPEEIDLAALLREICQLHREIAPGSRIEERFATPVSMAGDPKLLFQAFSNLLSNAIKYSASGSLVEISAGLEAGKILVTVKDSGIGIPASDIDQLFERYYRGSNVSGIVGTGVGLYLVKMVLEVHGGEIAVESSEGKGSKFSVRLPVRAAPKDEAPSPSVLPSVLPESADPVEQEIKSS
ncbi:MAG TPA: ATP-binding protein [Pseudomonadota bacterium]|nr:ATP-binding protein [Pseudomonadota bacterium]